VPGGTFDIEGGAVGAFRDVNMDFMAGVEIGVVNYGLGVISRLLTLSDTEPVIIPMAYIGLARKGFHEDFRLHDKHSTMVVVVFFPFESSVNNHV
jgi:hypothetical protein